jgi:hypothetical protein
MDFRERIRASNQWQLYAEAKTILSRHVGWYAREAKPELQTSDAYMIGIHHICDTLGI